MLGLVLLLVGCGKEAEYVKVVPADAEIVATFDCERIMNESGLFTSSDSELQKHFLDSFKKNLSAGEQDLLETILANPREVGVDWTQKVYAFVQSQTRIVAFVLPVSDREKLKASFLAFAGRKIHGRKFTEDDTFSWATGRQLSIAINDQVCLLITSAGKQDSQSLKAHVSEWLNQSKEESFASTDYNEMLLDLEGEIGVYASMSSLPENISLMASMAYSEDMDISSVKYLADVSFHPGKVVANGKVLYENSDFREWIKNQDDVCKKLDGKSLRYLPKNTPLWCGVGLDGNDFFDHLLEHPSYGKQLQNMSLPLDMEGIIRSINGDIALAYPNGLFVDVENDEILRICVGAIKTMGRFIGLSLDELSDNNYALVDENHTFSRWLGKETQLQLGMNDDSFYMLTSEEGTKKHEKEESLAAAPWADNVEDNLLFLAFNFREGLNLLDKYSTSGRNSKALQEYFDYVTYSQENIDTNTIVLSLIDQERNVLEQLIEFYLKNF